jgi:hypothetical protein
VREPERRKHRGRVGRGHDRTEQHRLEPGQVEQQVGSDPGEDGCRDDTHGRQKHSRHGDPPKPPPGGRKPALVENRGQPNHTNRPRKLGIVEFDPARPVRTQQHPEREERHQRRHPHPCGAERDRDAPGQNRSNQEKKRPDVHATSSPAEAAATGRKWLAAATDDPRQGERLNSVQATTDPPNLLLSSDPASGTERSWSPRQHVAITLNE